MSQQNVEMVRRGLDAWNRRDWEAGLADLDPDIVWRTSGVVPDLETSYRGHDGVMEFWRAWTDSWDHISVDTEELVDLGDHVLVLAHFRAGSREEIKVDQPIAFLFTIGNGRLTAFQSYWERDTVWPDVEKLKNGL
jgi:ketosteroid isomerase-like protein